MRLRYQGIRDRTDEHRGPDADDAVKSPGHAHSVPMLSGCSRDVPTLSGRIGADHAGEANGLPVRCAVARSSRYLGEAADP